MLCKELKNMLNNIPDNAEIFISETGPTVPTRNYSTGKRITGFIEAQNRDTMIYRKGDTSMPFAQACQPCGVIKVK